METVFDYNITDKEREDIGISDKERYLAIVGEDTANLDLATLFHTRGDNDRMARYADKLPLDMKLDFYRTVVKKVRFKFVGGVETVFSVLKFNNPLGFYRLGELKRLTVLLLILSVRFRDKIEFQVFIRPFPVQVDVEV